VISVSNILGGANLGVLVVTIATYWYRVKASKKQEANAAQDDYRHLVEWRTNIQRDIKDVKDDVASIKSTLGNGTGLKADIRTLREVEAACKAETQARLRALERQGRGES
jgi:peptidoglycan hydrolase CwlO-like protein